MNRTIHSHDIEAGIANIEFDHGGIHIPAQDYVLIDIVPGTRYVMDAMGVFFDADYQMRAIEYLQASYERQIDAGYIQAAPVPPAPEYSPPPKAK